MPRFIDQAIERAIKRVIGRVTQYAISQSARLCKSSVEPAPRPFIMRQYFGMLALLSNINYISEALDVATGSGWYLRVCDHSADSTIALPDGLLFYNDNLGLLLEVFSGDTHLVEGKSFVSLKRGDEELIRITLDAFLYVPVMKAVSDVIDVIHADYLAHCSPWRRTASHLRIRHWRKYRAEQDFTYYDQYVAV